MAGENEGPEWNFTLDTKPLEVQARIFELLKWSSLKKGTALKRAISKDGCDMGFNVQQI